jgi:hypothetical protein
VNGTTPQPDREPLATREELETLGAAYRHLLEQHRRASAESRSRRRLEQRLAALSERFERVLAHTAVDDETRAGWRAHLHHGRAAPAEPAPGAPPVRGTRSTAEPLPAPIEIVTRGPVGRRARSRLRSELERLAQLAPRSPALVRGALTYDENPSLVRPAEAKATFELGGRAVRAHTTAAGTNEAIDLLVAHLRRAFGELRGREEARRRASPVAAPGHWRHGNLPSAPPAQSVRHPWHTLRDGP